VLKEDSIKQGLGPGEFTDDLEISKPNKCFPKSQWLWDSKLLTWRAFGEAAPRRAEWFQTQKATQPEPVPPGSHLDSPISRQGNNDFVLRPGDSQFQVCNILVPRHLDWIGLPHSPGRSPWGEWIPITQDSPLSLRESFLGRTTKADHTGDWRGQKWD